MKFMTFSDLSIGDCFKPIKAGAVQCLVKTDHESVGEDYHRGDLGPLSNSKGDFGLESIDKNTPVILLSPEEVVEAKKAEKVYVLGYAIKDFAYITPERRLYIEVKVMKTASPVVRNVFE